MTAVHREAAFEAGMEESLLAGGWVKGVASDYRRGLGMDSAVLFQFVGATQPKRWSNWIAYFGGDANRAQVEFTKLVAAQLDARGTIDLLRYGVEHPAGRLRLAYFRPAHALTPELYSLYDANLVTVTRQVHHSESNTSSSLDLLLSVNGLPVATVEVKNQITGQTVQHAIHQYRTDRTATDLIFAKRTIAHFAVDQDQVFVTTRLAGHATVFLPFNQGSGGPGQQGGAGNPAVAAGYRSAYLWEQVWRRDNWLDLLARFVHEDKPASGKKKPAGPRKIIFPRYHQWDVVTKLVADAAVRGPGRNYLIQHSAGSGKSNSLAWLAHRLSNLHTPADMSLLSEEAVAVGLGPNQKVFDKVIVVTDRVVLDRQLQDTIWQFEHTPGVVERIDESSQQLADALAGSTAQIIITTLQKFPVIAKAAAGTLAGKRFAVIVDEAHSSQSGESAKDLKAVLGTPPADKPDGGSTTGSADVWDAAEAFDAAVERANDAEDAVTDTITALRASAVARGQQDTLSFFAFTATPKTKTLELFGERISDPSSPGGIRLEPFHLYSMRQAIEEGFILDVLANYVTYRTYFRLANGLTSDDPEVDKGKANAALARFVSLHESNLAQKAEIIVEHFRAKTAKEIGGTAKAMVVTRSRLHAVRYKQAIEEYITQKHYTDLRALVAFSGKVEDPDVPDVAHTESSMNFTPNGKRIPETETARRFQGDPENGFPVGDYQVLIVAEKYQTGFDEPRLHTMYVDKKLEGVKAVQTLSRLNRMLSGKGGTFVLDFANKADDIRDAFAPYYQRTWAEPTDPMILWTLKNRILGTPVIHPDEMRALVTGLLGTEKQAHAALYVNTDPAIARYQALPDTETKEDFRTAVRDYVRLYAFLGQILPPHEGLEELYRYCKILATRLPKEDDDGGAIDISDAAVLTHLRTEIVDDIIAPLPDGDTDALPGMAGGGAGKTGPKPVVRLSSLIDQLNEKFGTDLTEADQLLFDQGVEAAASDPDLIEKAKSNTEENFGFAFDKVFADILLDRQSANDDLFRAFFNRPEFQCAITQWARKAAYRTILDREDIAE